MSGKALNYVKPLTSAPNGESLTIQEKAILLYLANSHNEEQRATWVGILTIAEHMPGQSTLVDRKTGEKLVSRMSERRVRQIIASLVRKEVLWREPRTGTHGRQHSNFLRFTELDGQPSFQAKVIEQKLQMRGRQAADRSNALRHARNMRVGEFSTQTCGRGCEMPHPGVRDASSARCEMSQGTDATSHRDGCEISHPDPKRSSTESLTESTVIPRHSICGDLLEEARRAQRRLEQRRKERSSPSAAAEIVDTIAKRLHRDGKG
jgi:hypothetical protein